MGKVSRADKMRMQTLREQECGRKAIIRANPLDLGVDTNKSTWVDLSTSSRVGSVLPGAVDSKSNLELKSDFTASRLEIDLN